MNHLVGSYRMAGTSSEKLIPRPSIAPSAVNLDHPKEGKGGCGGRDPGHPNTEA